MTELTVDNQTIRYDRDATMAAYRGVELGYADECPVGESCLDCKNFAVQRAVAYPSSFKALLELLGIDPAKEAEIFTYSDEPSDHQLSGGWFYLVGELVAGEAPSHWQTDSTGFDRHFSTSFPDPGDFKGRPVLALHFNVQLRWVV